MKLVSGAKKAGDWNLYSVIIPVSHYCSTLHFIVKVLFLLLWVQVLTLSCNYFPYLYLPLINANCVFDTQTFIFCSQVYKYFTLWHLSLLPYLKLFSSSQAYVNSHLFFYYVFYNFIFYVFHFSIQNFSTWFDIGIQCPFPPPPLEMRVPFPVSSGKDSRPSRRISRGGALNREVERNSRGRATIPKDPQMSQSTPEEPDFPALPRFLTL